MRPPALIQETLKPRTDQGETTGAEALADDPPVPRSRTIAHLLDNSLRIPGTEARIGIDPLLGFIPGIGDALSAAFGFVILYDAARCRLGKFTQFRIALNVLTNAVFGAVPLIGDLFSAVFKSNARNYNLLARDLAEKQTGFSEEDLESVGFPWFAVGLILAVLAVIAAVLIGLFWIIGKLLA